MDESGGGCVRTRRRGALLALPLLIVWAAGTPLGTHREALKVELLELKKNIERRVGTVR